MGSGWHWSRWGWLWTRKCTFGFPKRQAWFWPDERLLAYREGLCDVEVSIHIKWTMRCVKCQLYFVSVFCHLCLINRDELAPEVRVTSGFRSGVNEISAVFGSPIFKGQEVLDCLTLVEISDRLSRNVGDCTNLHRATSQKNEGFWQQNTFEAWLELSMLSFQRLKCRFRTLFGQRE
jgi:hypothetical protein